MLSRSLNLALRLSPSRVLTQVAAKNSTASLASETTDERDPAPYFFNKDIQQLLKTLTRPDPDKIFRRRLDGRSLQAPEYKFMTNEQLEKEMHRANEKMWRFLQMPPIVKLREDKTRVLSKDPAIAGFSEGKYVFTDITYGVKNKDRIIVVREVDGTLRTATYEERDRLNQIYAPEPGREVYMPKMFKDEYLQPILERGDYEFVLNRACVQFDPDNPNYQRVVQTTYDYVDEHMHYDKLRSTRHFGPMVFHLAWNKKIDNLLLENLETERIEDASLAIRLYYVLHSSEKAKKEIDHIARIKDYIETESNIKRKLDHALKMYLELEEERKKVQESIDAAHGKKQDNDEEIKT